MARASLKSPQPEDPKTEASHGVIIVTIITTMVIISASIFEQPLDIPFERLNRHKSSHFADEEETHIGSDVISVLVILMTSM